MFADNSFFFRNALVRANYSNIPKKIYPTPVYLERFFANLLGGADFELKSRFLLAAWSPGKRHLFPRKGNK